MSSPIMITLNHIIQDEQPSMDHWLKVRDANGGKNADYNQPFLLSSLLDSNDLSFTVWCFRCLEKYHMLWRRYALWCARQVMHLITYENCTTTLDLAERSILNSNTDGYGYRHTKDAVCFTEAVHAVYTAYYATLADVSTTAEEVYQAVCSVVGVYHEQSKIIPTLTEKLILILDAGEWVGD